MKLRVKKIAENKYQASFTGRHWFKWIKRWTPKNVKIEDATVISSVEDGKCSATSISGIAGTVDPSKFRINPDKNYFTYTEVYGDGHKVTGVEPNTIEFNNAEMTKDEFNAAFASGAVITLKSANGKSTTVTVTVNPIA